MNRSTCLISLLALSLLGCPFVYGPPDLSNVLGDGTTAPTDGDADVDTDADGDAPLLVDVSSKTYIEKLGFAIVLADADGDLVGGKVTLTDGKDTVNVAIPAGFDKWDINGTSLLSVPGEFLSCSDGYHATWEVVVTDLAGRKSETGVVDIDITGLGIQPDAVQYNQLGNQADPFVVCAKFNTNAAGAAQRELELRADYETQRFRVPVGGPYYFQLGWPGESLDADLWVFTDQFGATLGESLSYGNAWEQVTATLVAGDSYLIEPAFWEEVAGTPPYTVMMHVRPD